MRIFSLKEDLYKDLVIEFLLQNAISTKYLSFRVYFLPYQKIVGALKFLKY